MFYLILVSYLVMPFKLILASSMANVMWSWCSIPLATLLNATYIQVNKQIFVYNHQPSYYQKQKVFLFNKNSLYLEEVLSDESESL